MKFLRFEAVVEPEKTIRLPEPVASQVKPGEPVRMDLWIQEDDTAQDDQAWEQMAAEELLKAYSEEDSIYDQIYGGRCPAGGASIHVGSKPEDTPGAGDARHRR